MENRSLSLDCWPRLLRLQFDFEKARSVASCLRVLVVEDFAPFRRFISSTLGKRRDLRIICEVADGLEAVQKVEELQPDLIILDIGLPTLNGIEAARQIRKRAPESKIIFLSQESSPEIVQEALTLGALGYVAKTRARSDLSHAVEAAIRGNQFVSGTITNITVRCSGTRMRCDR